MADNFFTRLFRRPENMSAANQQFLQGVEVLDLPTTSGTLVTAETSKNIATAYRCINILSDDVAKLPLQTFISRSLGQIERVKPSFQMQNIAWLMEVSPNRWMTPLIFKKMAVQWLLTYGATYIWQPARRAGQRRELFVLRSDETWPLFDEFGNLWYRTKFANGAEEWLPDVEILPLLINSVDGISGRSVITYARETLGRQLAAYEHQNKTYSQGLAPAAVAYFAGELNKDARAKVRESYSEGIAGSQGRGKLAVFDNKVTKFETISMSMVDAQFLESIQENDSEIANYFGVEERGTIEDVLEPFLIQSGFMMRTPRGRVATSSAYLHFGLTPPQTQKRQRQRDLELFGRSEE